MYTIMAFDCGFIPKNNQADLNTVGWRIFEDGFTALDAALERFYFMFPRTQAFSFAGTVVEQAEAKRLQNLYEKLKVSV